jgi:hypothetical protein
MLGFELGTANPAVRWRRGNENIARIYIG